MTDEAQVKYEHTNALSIELKTNDLTITWHRPFLSIDVRPDGQKMVTDPNVYQRVFECNAVVTAADLKDKIDAWLIDSITYSGAYPRLSVVYLSGAKTLTNVEVAITACKGRMIADGQWMVSFQFTEKSL